MGTAAVRRRDDELPKKAIRLAGAWGRGGSIITGTINALIGENDGEHDSFLIIAHKLQWMPKSPVILQGSAGARKYAGEPFLRHLMAAAVEAYPDLPIVMHQDHGASPDVCMGAIRSGFTSVMMDGSLKDDAKTPADYAYNVAVTRKVVGFAHAVGVSVEAELGCLGSLETLAGYKEDGHGAEGKLTREQLLTDPDEAARFVDDTQCDALAIAIGTSHGAYKFKHQPTGGILAIDRIRAIHRRLPNTHLVMHGSSSVPQRLLEEIRCYGGDIRETYGVPVTKICEGIRHGEDEHRYRHSPRHDRRHAPHHEK
jgi:fructose-bisphosphate aldolase, class II